MLVALAPYRLLFVGACALFLGAAFYLAYRPVVEKECAPGSSCPASSSRQKQRLFLWIVTAIISLIVAFPLYSPFLF